MKRHSLDTQAFAPNARAVLLREGFVVADARADLLTGPGLSRVYSEPMRVEGTEGGRIVCVPALGTDGG